MRRLLLGALLFLAACSTAPPPAPPAGAGPTAPPPARQEVQITILYTADEHGWLLAHDEKGRVQGGAAETLGRWIKDEGHCVGDACKDPATLALSGGDNYTGPAISTYFTGGPMADAMARMGYAASAFGNHEFDFGRDRFLDDRQRSKMVYLAANLHAAPTVVGMDLPAYVVFERRGVKIGVVGLATDTTLHAAMASRFEGITFEAEEPAMDRAVHAAWAAGADLVVGIAHECAPVLKSILDRHPDWKLSFMGAGHCHRKSIEQAGGAALVAPGWRLDHYARVRLTVDPARPAGERVIAVEPSLVDVEHAEGAAPAALPDPEIASMAATWKTKIDAVLGEPIGWTASGLDKESAEMGRWIAGALREESGADVAIVNGSGIRQNLPKGAITKASVWSILPFDNRIMVVRIKGKSLAYALHNREAVAAGATRAPDGSWVMADKKPLDPEGVYAVATVDYLYFGGDHFTFQKDALDTQDKGVDWRDAVIAWTRKLKTTEAVPIEGKLAGGGARPR
jgi:2',3'-cyclic-nucleotide 2'-phosphodiesterase (5'-nucleotidase family)